MSGHGVAAEDDDDDEMAVSSQLEASAGVHDGTPSSVESTPEPDVPHEAAAEQPAQPQKRKGGRKPIYATSEERKQRNRQAQAAFRERRTEYIKQLEATIKTNEETLGSLQQSHRTAADECLMLRYKNSLLERILLEKGIDVQAELQLKTGSSILPQGYVPPGTSAPQQQQTAQPPLQRTAVQRQHARRSGGPAFLPKLAPGQPSQDANYTNGSPQGHPTPPSHASSPTNAPLRSPMTIQQGGATPPASAVLAQGQQQYPAFARSSQQPNTGFYQIPHQPSPEYQRQAQQAPQPSRYQSSVSAVSSHSNGSQQGSGPPHMTTGQGSLSINAGQPPASAYYPKHEYDTEHNHPMLDHAEQDAATDQQSNSPPHQLRGTYPPQSQYDQQRQAGGSADLYQRPSYGGAQRQSQQIGMHSQSYSQAQIGQQQSNPTSAGASGQFAMGQVIDPNDPLLDADPFGLSASMHYPTSYSPMDQRR